MRPVVYSYTDPVTGVANTTLNDGTNFTCKIPDSTPLVFRQTPKFLESGDAQEPALTGVIPQGAVLRLQFNCKQTNWGDGYDILAAMFGYDERQKTLVIRDADDSDRAYYAICRNVGVMSPRGRNVDVEVALTSVYLLTTLTTTETTWTNASSAPKTVTIDKGNSPALPVIEITPSTAGTSGNRYRRPITTYNYTRNAAVGYPIEVTNGGLDTSAMIYSSSTASLQLNGAINSVVTSANYDNPTGSFPTLPFLMFSGTEQIRVTAKTGTTSGTLTIVRGVNGSTAGSHSDNEVFAVSLMAYDGRDIRIYRGIGSGSLNEIPYWFGGATGATGGMNTSATKIWIPQSYAARAIGNLSATITDADTSLIITNAEGIFPDVNGMLLVEDEKIPYEAYDAATFTFTGLTRGAKGTTAASHTADVTVRAINDAWMYYGNPLPTSKNYNAYLSLKPVFALTSTNDAWTFNDFASIANTTIYEWKPIQALATDIIYFGDASASVPYTRPTNTDPVSFIGISVIGASARGEWLLSVPFYLTSFSTTTAKRLNVATSHAALRVYKNGTIQAETIIAAQANSWSSNTSYTVTADGNRVSLFMQNFYTTPYARRSAVQLSSAVINHSTETTSETMGRPYVNLGAQQGIYFDVDTVITNTTTGENIRIVRPDVESGKAIRVDTLMKKVTYTGDSSNAFPNLQRYAVRSEWLKLLLGANELTCSQAGIDIIISWQGRNNSFG